jgi:hypothetical protein
MFYMINIMVKYAIFNKEPNDHYVGHGNVYVPILSDIAPPQFNDNHSRLSFCRQLLLPFTECLFTN